MIFQARRPSIPLTNAMLDVDMVQSNETAGTSLGSVNCDTGVRLYI